MPAGQMTPRGGARVDPRQAQVIRAVADGATIEEAAAEAGCTVLQAERFLDDVGAVSAVIDRMVKRLTVSDAPYVVAKLRHMVDGRTLVKNLDGSTSYQSVRPEMQLAACQAILKLARIEEHTRPPDRDALGDLAAMTPDQLRAFISAAEDRLATQAQDVSAPDAPNDAHQRAQSAMPINLLD